MTRKSGVANCRRDWRITVAWLDLHTHTSAVKTHVRDVGMLHTDIHTHTRTVHFIKDAHIKMHWYNQDIYRM